MAKRVVKIYKKRMQIEEAFRDLKSSRYGLGFEDAYSKKIKRIEILLLIAALASFIAWLVGWIAEQNKLHYQFQSNSIKDRRVLSFFYLGCEVIKRRIKITINMLETAIKGGLVYA
jgi:transposase